MRARRYALCWAALVLVTSLVGAVGCEDDGPASSGPDTAAGSDPGSAGASADQPRGAEDVDGVAPGDNEGATETNAAPASCTSDADCPLTSCGPADPMGARFCVPSGGLPAGAEDSDGTDADAGV